MGQENERIRSLYHELTGLGEEASSRIALRPGDPLDAIEDRPDAAPSEDVPKVAVKKSSTSGALPITRKPLPIANPLRACISALRIIDKRRPLFFGLGAVFVGSLSIASMLQYDTRTPSNLALLQLLFLGLVAYVVGGWIRVARSGGGQRFKPGLTFGHITIAIVVGASVYVFAPIIHGGRFETVIAIAARLTQLWPYFGPYGWSLIKSTPPGAIFLEPFTQAAALLPTLLFMPLITGEYQSMRAQWMVFLFQIPFVVVSILVATVPIALLNLGLADWAQRELAAGHQLLIAFILSAICYAHLVAIATIIGDCYRRVFNPGS